MRKLSLLLLLIILVPKVCRPQNGDLQYSRFKLTDTTVFFGQNYNLYDLKFINKDTLTKLLPNKQVDSVIAFLKRIKIKDVLIYYSQNSTLEDEECKRKSWMKAAAIKKYLNANGISNEKTTLAASCVPFLKNTTPTHIKNTNEYVQFTIMSTNKIHRNVKVTDEGEQVSTVDDNTPIKTSSTEAFYEDWTKYIDSLSNPTKALFKITVADMNGKNALFDYSLTNAKVKLIGTNNDSIVKKTNFYGDLFIQTIGDVYQIEVSYNLYKYKDIIELKKGYYTKLYLRFDSNTKTLVDAKKIIIEYSKIDFYSEQF